jgi:hypothetical protein
MSSTVAPEWFATHGWLRNELDFLAFNQGTSMPMLAVFIGAVEYPGCDIVDRFTADTWHAIRARFPDWRGQRVALGELWFFASGVEKARDAVAEILGAQNVRCETRSVAMQVPADARSRLRSINALGRAVLGGSACEDGIEFWRVQVGGAFGQ